MSFQAPFSITDMRRLQMAEAMQEQQQMQNNQQMVLNGLMQLGGAYSDWSDKKAAIGAMDKGVGLMSDIGAIQPDIRDKFMNLNEREKPFVFDLLRQGMFAPYAAGQSAGFQAAAWDKYKQNWPAGGSPSSARNQYGYVYQGP